MEINLNRELLVQLGLGHLSPSQQRRVLQRWYEVLELRVGTLLANGLTERQRLEFETYMEGADEGGALAFLSANVPEYHTLAQNEFIYIASHIASRLGDARGAESS